MTNTNDLTPKTVCAECLKKTKIGYDDGGRFFMPHFKSINHVEVGYSKIITNPLTIFAEWLLAKFYALKDGLVALAAKLFPRRPKIYGKQMDSWLVGKIIFATQENVEVPIHHLPLEFWGRTKLGQWRKLSEGYSAPDGTFRLPFELRCARRFGIRSLRFEICQISHIYFKDGQANTVHNTFHCIKISKSDLIGMEYNLRNIPLCFWEYRTDVKNPRVVIKAHGKDAPQQYTEAILQRAPWMVGFSCYLWNIDRTLWIAAELKRILTVSDSSKRDIAADFGVEADRIEVIPLGVDEVFVPPTTPRVSGRLLAMASADSPNQWVRFETPTTTAHGGGLLTIQIEEPESTCLFLRFTYNTVFARGSEIEDAPYAEFLRQAYIAADIDTVRVIRMLVATGGIDAIASKVQ